MLEPGLSAEFAVDVTPRDTAASLGSGEVEVLGTPRVVALVEEATVRAVAGALEPGQTTVGTEVVLRHRRPSVPGAGLIVAARLDEVDGIRLAFSVTVHEDGVLVADGTIRRAIVDRAAFLSQAEKRD
ncbi:thioesterase family protein [Nocardia sp. NPDC058497]|uniref:thioesterase family protein n=1 Tax=Nocardia sp. NPDC058497 TaxID=3346529 RepID=UPI00364F03A4